MSTNSKLRLAIELLDDLHSRRRAISLPDGAEPVFGHKIDTEDGSSGGGVLDSDGYLVGVHVFGGCGGSNDANFAEPITALFDVSPVLNGQAGEPSPPDYSVPYLNDRMLVTTLGSNGSVQDHTLVSFDSYSPSYENAQADAAVFSTGNQLRLAGSVSDDHGEYFAAVARVNGKFVLGRYVLNTGAVGLNGDDERFRAASIARTLTGVESALMAAGQVKVGAERRVLVAAFHPDATALQTSFGQSNPGFTITDVPSLSDEFATAIYTRSVLEHYVAQRHREFRRTPHFHYSIQRQWFG